MLGLEYIQEQTTIYHLEVLQLTTYQATEPWHQSTPADDIEITAHFSYADSCSKGITVDRASASVLWQLPNNVCCLS